MLRFLSRLLSPFLFEQQQTKESREREWQHKGARERGLLELSFCCCCCCCHHHRQSSSTRTKLDDHHHRKAQRTVVDANKSHCTQPSSRDIFLCTVPSTFRLGCKMPVARRGQCNLLLSLLLVMSWGVKLFLNTGQPRGSSRRRLE